MMPTPVHQLLTIPQSWTQGTFARDAKLKSVPTVAIAAVSWSVRGAIMRCYGQRQDRNEVVCRLAFHLRRELLLPDGITVGSIQSCQRAIDLWNDHESTTHIEILEALQTLGI